MICNKVKCDENKKNLSDEDMLKGYEEEVSFENAVYGDEPVKIKNKNS